MAELLRLDSAKLYGNHSAGCVWSFFHVFDSYQRPETKKMLSYRRMVAGRQYSAGIDTHMENDEAEGKDVRDKAVNLIEEQKGNNMKKGSGKARILKFINKKLLRRQKHRGKTTCSSSELMDTIYNSESTSNVPQSDSGQMSTDSETSEHESSLTSGFDGFVGGKKRALGALNSGNNISCISQEYDEMGNYLLDEHIILKKKLFEARDALLKQKDTDPKGMTVEFLLRSKIFLDTLQLFNSNREALYNVCNGQNSSLSSDIQALGLNKSPSLSGSDFLGNAGVPISSHKQIEDDSFVSQVHISKSVCLPDNTDVIVPSTDVLPVSHEGRKQRESKTVLGRLRVLKQRIKGVIVENREERHRISMDRILHKVPSGRKPVEDEGFKFGSTGKIAPNSFRRSLSLVESLDRYSYLLDSISSNELREAPRRSNSVREGSGLLQRKLPKIHGRMLSNPELLRSYSYSKDVQRETNIALQSSIKETPESDGYDKLNSSLDMLSAVEEIASEQMGSLDSNTMVNSVQSIASDKTLAPNVEISTTGPKGHGRQLDSISTVEGESLCFNEKESTVYDSPHIKPEKQSPTSVLDSNIEEGPVSPLILTAVAGSELQLLHDEDLKEQHPISEPCNDSNEPNVAELCKPDFYDELSTTVTGHANSLPAHFDKKDAAEFTYVKLILSRSGYDTLFFETYDSSDEVNSASHMLFDMPCDEQLMYDLIHEVLLEIYEYSTAPSSWLPHFHSKIRSMPTGSHLLEEVWAEIRWHLCSSHSTTTDDILARNFAKDDGWMNLYRDAECYGLLLEQLILDDLVDEIILDSDSL